MRKVPLLPLGFSELTVCGPGTPICGAAGKKPSVSGPRARLSGADEFAVSMDVHSILVCAEFAIGYPQVLGGSNVGRFLFGTASRGGKKFRQRVASQFVGDRSGLRI